MSDIKKTAREMFDKKFTHGSHIDLAGRYHKEPIRKIHGEIEVIENIHKFIDQIIDLAIAEERKRVVEMIKEYAEPYENSKWLNEVNAQKIINLITNNNETF